MMRKNDNGKKNEESKRMKKDVERRESRKNGITEMVFILDSSGSMSGLVSDTIGGFNGMIARQKKEEGKAYVTTVLFDTDTKILHDRIDLQRVGSMTDCDYCCGGCTALFDAVGGTIQHIKDIHHYIRKEDVPEHVLFVITTDGMENASRKYSQKEVRKLVEQQKKCGWEFIFLGANIDAAQTGESFGIAKENAINYCSDEKGTRVLYESVGRAMASVRCAGELDADWAVAVAEDYEERGK